MRLITRSRVYYILSLHRLGLEWVICGGILSCAILEIHRTSYLLATLPFVAAVAAAVAAVFVAAVASIARLAGGDTPFPLKGTFYNSYATAFINLGECPGYRHRTTL